MSCGIGLFNPKHPINVGSCLRAAKCFNVQFVVSTGRRYKRVASDTPNTPQHIPFFSSVENLKDYIPFNHVPVAVDLISTAKSIVDYQHPPQAFYIFGPEDGTLGNSITSWCRDIIYVPTVHCMNLAATVHVVLYDRMYKNEH